MKVKEIVSEIRKHEIILNFKGSRPHTRLSRKITICNIELQRGLHRFGQAPESEKVTWVS